MIRLYLVTITLAIEVLNANAQLCPDTLWSRLYGRQPAPPTVAYNALIMTDGGYLIAGFQGFWPFYDVWLARTDSFGDTLWTRTYGEPETNDGCLGVAASTDGNFVLTGWRGWGDNYSPGDSAVIYVLKIDSDGDTLWTRTFGRQGLMTSWDIIEVSGGGYAIGGATNYFEHCFYSEPDPDRDNSDVLLLRLGENGDSLWSQTYGGIWGDGAFRVVETLDGGFVLCGATASFGDTLGDAYLICTDSTGQQLWDQHYGLAGVGDYAMELDETSDQGYLIAGEAYIAPGSEVLAICVDSTGSVQWQRTYRHSFSSGAGGLSILPGDSFIVAAASLRGVGLIDLYMIWGDAQGNLFRECTYLFPHPTYEIYPRCLQTMPDGSYLISGSTSDQTDAAFLLRTEPDRLAIGDHDSLVPSEFSVFVYPNPFNSSTTIEFSLPLTSSPLELTLYNTLGQVAYHETLRPTSTLVRHSISAEGLASGVYILSCQVGEMRATQKLLLLR